MEKDSLDIINQCSDFLSRSSKRFASTLNRATKDLRRYSGEFWDDDFRKLYRPGKKRACLSLNNWNVICNAIASPMTASLASSPDGMAMLQSMPSEQTRMAILVLTTVPILFAYPFFQRFFIQGLTIGSVKG